MKTILGLIVLSLTAGCTSPNTTDDMADMAVADLAGADLTTPTLCNPVDPMNDGQSCASAACPMGTIGVTQGGGGCICRTKCDPGMHLQCSCNRLCLTLTSSAPDGGVIGGGCLPANTPAQRCGVDGNNLPLFGQGICAQNLTCAGPTGGRAYCLYNCAGQADCPAQTQCAPIMNNMGMVIGMACQYTAGAAGVAAGAACTVGAQPCVTGHICDGTCKPQCDGVGGACAAGTCTQIADALSGKVVGHVCK